jgi:hypothetical protein
MQDNLPVSTLIALPRKMIAIISLSGTGICGGNDYGCIGSTEIGLPEVKVGRNQLEMSRYALDMEGFWLRDNYRIIAAIDRCW